LLIVRDIARSRQFYADVLGARVLSDGSPPLLRFYNTWLALSTEGGPTDDRACSKKAAIDRLKSSKASRIPATTKREAANRHSRQLEANGLDDPARLPRQRVQRRWMPDPP
jgi:catechol 2,3-dioxygenase-like lactoylglutathione lyase family enzyme